MERKIYDYQATEEIKHIVIGIQDLHCRVSLEDAYYRNENQRPDFIAHAKRSAKHQILDSIGDFIQVIEVDGERYIEAVLFLPYVKDSVVDGLEAEIKSNRNIIDGQADMIGRLREEIRLLSRPWWKKLFNIDLEIKA